jgi:hypothetical protein
MTVPNLFLAICIVSGIVGFSLLVYSFISRKRIELMASLGTVRFKFVTTIIKYFSGLPVVIAPFAVNRGDWFFAGIVGGVSFLNWALLEILIDMESRRHLRELQVLLDRAESSAEARTELIVALRSMVKEKVDRLLKRLSDRPVRISASRLRKSLDPELHLENVIGTLGAFLKAQVPRQERIATNFRIGLYIAVDDRLQPCWWIDLNNPTHSVFSSFSIHEESFRLSGQALPSTAVLCIRNRSTIIVEDCVLAAAEKRFHFLDERQPSYLKSMLACYLGDVYHKERQFRPACLVIDTNRAGHFCEADRDLLQLSCSEFGLRIKLELLIDAILSPGGQRS